MAWLKFFIVFCLLAGVSVPIASAQSPTVSLPYYPLGPCPTCETPNISVTTVPSGTNASIAPTGAITNPEPTDDPCVSNTSIATDKKSKHWEHDGGISGFMEALIRFFTELINLLLKLLGGGTPNPNPNPTPSPTIPAPTAQITNEPTEVPTVQPTVAPCNPSQAPAGPTTVPSTNTPSIPISGTGQLPAQILNLSNWKLQLPIGGEEDPDEIKQPQLATYTLDPWFVPQGNSVRFRAPVNGVTTSGSNYPRSELREMTNNGATNASWSTATGTNTMTIDEAITAVPVTKKHVVAGQIHDGNKDVIVVRLEMPKLYINISGEQGPTLDSNYTLGKRFTVRFEAVNNQISIYYNGSQTPAYTMTKSVPTAYFKAGAYTQSNCTTETAGPCDATNYGEVIIYNVAITHQ